jgi:hypothetical protein
VAAARAVLVCDCGARTSDLPTAGGAQARLARWRCNLLLGFDGARSDGDGGHASLGSRVLRVIVG